MSYRFLHESPWERLRRLRAAMPDTCLQMLLRGSNAVGYKSYPDNVVQRFVALAAEAGIDIFRIFDCFNDVEQMRVSCDAVRKAGKVAEMCICFSGDFLRKTEKIYTLDYFQGVAKQMAEAGAHMLAIKDMAGLVKPGHAKPLIAAIRKGAAEAGKPDLPIHFHTHSTSGVSLASNLAMVDAGCDVVDCAIASMSENTSQPNLNAFCASLEGHPRDTGISYLALERLDTYWARTRMLYAPFENGMTSGSAKTFEHQIPGGQYSNLLVQAKSMGLWARWAQVLDMCPSQRRILLFSDQALWTH